MSRDARTRIDSRPGASWRIVDPGRARHRPAASPRRADVDRPAGTASFRLISSTRPPRMDHGRITPEPGVGPGPDRRGGPAVGRGRPRRSRWSRSPRSGPVELVRPLVEAGAPRPGRELSPGALEEGRGPGRPRRPVRWHLIGHLQGNKAKRTLPLVRMIHAVDSLKLLQTLDALAAELADPPVGLPPGQHLGRGGQARLVGRGDPRRRRGDRRLPADPDRRPDDDGRAGGPTPRRPGRRSSRLREVRDDLRRRTGLPLDRALDGDVGRLRGGHRGRGDAGPGRLGAVRGGRAVIELTPHAEGTIVPVCAQPGARRNAILGERAGALRVAVTAAPEKGKANAAIRRCWPRAWAAGRRRSASLSGETSRQKRFLVGGLTPDELRRRIDALLARSRPARCRWTSTESCHQIVDEPHARLSRPRSRSTPWTGPPPAAGVRVPGSKSLTNRALIVAALADGPSTLTGALDSDDTRVMVEALQALGIAVEHDPATATIIEVEGCGGQIPGQRGRPLRRQLGDEPAVPDRDAGHRPGDVPPRRHAPDAPAAGRRPAHGPERPGGRRPERPRDRLPARHGRGQRAGRRLCVRPGRRLQPVPQRPADGPALRQGHDHGRGRGRARLAAVRGDDAERDGGLRRQGRQPQVPPVRRPPGHVHAAATTRSSPTPRPPAISSPWPRSPAGRSPSRGSARRACRATSRSSTSSSTWAAPSTREPDATTVHGGPLRAVDVDMNAISDTVMTLAVVALFADGVTRIRNVAHIRHKETDRIAALATELRKLGATVDEQPDGLIIDPPAPDKLQPARIATYDDHRMAMSFALAGLRSPRRHDPRPRLRGQDLPGLLGRPRVGAIDRDLSGGVLIPASPAQGDLGDELSREAESPDSSSRSGSSDATRPCTAPPRHRRTAEGREVAARDPRTWLVDAAARVPQRPLAPTSAPPTNSSLPAPGPRIESRSVGVAGPVRRRSAAVARGRRRGPVPAPRPRPGSSRPGRNASSARSGPARSGMPRR